jgi:hypothetical protein
LLEDFRKDPLNLISTPINDCALLKTEDGRTLLININSEYMTNVAANYGFEQINGESDWINLFVFFDD